MSDDIDDEVLFIIDRFKDIIPKQTDPRAVLEALAILAGSVLGNKKVGPPAQFRRAAFDRFVRDVHHHMGPSMGGSKKRSSPP